LPGDGTSIHHPAEEFDDSLLQEVWTPAARDPDERAAG
jgi:hypothetical protein